MTIPRKLSENFVATVVDDEVLIVDLDGGELLSLAGTGKAVWDLIDGVRSVEAIVADLAADYAGDEGLIESDVAALLVDLEAAGLVSGH